jgi:hypothetical protein
MGASAVGGGEHYAYLRLIWLTVEAVGGGWAVGVVATAT